MEGKYINEIVISDDLKASLEWLKECAENNYIYETGNSKELYEYIIKLQNELKELDEDMDKLWETY